MHVHLQLSRVSSMNGKGNNLLIFKLVFLVPTPPCLLGCCCNNVVEVRGGGGGGGLELKG